MGFNYLFSNRFRNYFFVSLVLSVAMLYGVFAMPLVTYNSPTVTNSTTVTNNWTYINITIDKNMSNASIEWGNSSGYTNVSMANTSLVNWYKNMTLLVDDVYNYTIWTQNTTSNWSQSDRRFVVIDTVMPYNLSACQNLTVENGSYVLVSNVSSNGTCFNIMANNIILDGAGYTVEYAKTEVGYGVNNSGGFDNITVKNIDVLSGNVSVDDTYGMYFSGSNNSIFNNEIIIFGSGSYGVYFTNSEMNNISNNTIRTMYYFEHAMFLLNTNKTIVSDNNVNVLYDNSDAISIEDSYLNNFNNNTIYTERTGGFGIQFTDSDYNNISYNDINTSSSGGYGVSFYNSDENRIMNNTINTQYNDASGIYISSSNRNKILENNITTLGGDDTYGINIELSTNLILRDNVMDTQTVALFIGNKNTSSSNNSSYYNHTIDTTNTEQGRPIYYYFNNDSIVIENLTDVGQLYVTNSTNITIRNITSTKDGFSLALVKNSTIVNSSIVSNGDSIPGVSSYYSDYNNITNNTITTYGNLSDGIYFVYSDSNNFINNTITTSGNSMGGIYLYGSDLNTFDNNTISTSGESHVFYLEISNNNIILNNTISGDSSTIYGLYVTLSNNTNIKNNTIVMSGSDSVGVYFLASNNNNMTNNLIDVVGGGVESGNGIFSKQSKYLILTGNKMNTSGYAIFFNYNSDVSYYNHAIDITNTEQGSPIYYYFGKNDTILIEDVNDIGQLIVANSTNVTVRNVTIDKDGIFFASTINSSIIDSNITTTGNGVHGIYFYESADFNNVSNNTITMYGVGSDGIYIHGDSNKISNNTVTTFGTNGDGISIYSNLNQIFENTIKTYNGSSDGFYLFSAENNTITNNEINTSGNSSMGVSLQLSDTNTFMNNNIFVSGQYAAYGMYIKNSAMNSIIGGSVISENNYDYFIDAIGNSNTFQNTNFTNSRIINFNGNTSSFNYNNDASGSVWVNTGVSVSTNITREIINWNNSLVKWNDTNGTSGITATYNISGLTASKRYDVYNKTSNMTATRSLTTNVNGKLPSFSIFLNGLTQITVEKYIAPTTPDTGSGEPPVIDPPASGDGNYTGNDLNETDNNSDDDDSNPVVENKSTSKVAEDTSLKDKAQDKIDELNGLLGDVDDEAILAKIKEAEEALALGQYSKAYALALQAEDMITKLQEGADGGKSSTFIIVMIFLVLFGFTIVVAYFVYKKDDGIGIGDLETPSDTDSDGYTVPLDSTIDGVSVPVGNESASVDESFNSYDNSQTQNFDTLQFNQSDTNKLSGLSEGESNLEGVISPDNPVDVSDNKRNLNQTDEVEEELEDEFQNSIKKLRHENKDNS